MPEYRKLKDSDTWHWCRNCSNWPTGTAGVDYDSQQVPSGRRPASGELDNECRAKEREDNCRT